MIVDAAGATEVFTAGAANIDWFVARIAAVAPTPVPNRVLDVGCGDGSLLMALAEAMPGVSLIGVDLSPASIAAARARVERSPHRDRVSVACDDYMAFDPSPVGLVTAFGSLQAIEAPIDLVASALARDLAPAGLLLCVMPYRCLYNRTLNGVRHALGLVRGRWLDWTILQIAALLHRGQSQSWLRQRVRYMYLAPVHGEEELCEALRAKGFRVLHSEPAPHTSIGQLKQRLTVLAAPAPR